jgi:hypothetical protein
MDLIESDYIVFSIVDFVVKLDRGYNEQVVSNS